MPTDLSYVEKLAKDPEQVVGLEPREVTEWGLKQHFMIGQEYVRNFHSVRTHNQQEDFFMHHKYVAEDYYVQTTDTDRTKHSALAQLVGTFGFENDTTKRVKFDDVKDKIKSM